MIRNCRFLGILAAIFILGACRGNGDGSMASSSGPERGQLLENPPALLASYSVSDVLSKLTGNNVGEELLLLSLSPVCSVDVYQLKYETVDAKSQLTTASGALMVPSGLSTTCAGPRPIVLYAHGTTPLKTFNIADLTSADNTEGLLLAAIFASQGYIVVAPNYAGYDTSTLSYHPYLNADQQSKDMIDALTAARSALAAIDASDNHKLFVTGYSEGGFVAMATHRAMQTAGTVVTAAAPMSGPYALSAFADAIFMGEVNLSAAVNFALLISSYQHAYGNLYAQPTEIFEPQYASDIASLLPSATDISMLYSEGELPQNAFFSATAPAPQYVSMTPATMPADLAPAFAMGFGAGNLVTNSYRESYLMDAQAAPDGGFPAITTGLPPASPSNTLREALKTNDLRNWLPDAPVLLCAGEGDPSVFYLNTQLMQHQWTAQVAAGTVTVLDVDSPATSGAAYASIKSAFAAAKALVAAAAVAQGAKDAGALAVLEDYHATLVPPFCLYAVKSFFDGF